MLPKRFENCRESKKCLGGNIMNKKRLELGIDFFEVHETEVKQRTDGVKYNYLPRTWEGGKKIIVLRVEK